MKKLSRLQNMSIIKHDFIKSPALEHELSAIDLRLNDNIERFKQYTINQMIDEYSANPNYFELIECMKHLKPNSRILDIGVAYGFSSFLFLKNGHIVSVVEPSHTFCELIDRIASNNGVSMEIHECVIEQLHIDEKYDACIFNASLHHCDEPDQALDASYSLLNKNGKIVLMNEQVLKFYRRKNGIIQRLKMTLIS